MQLARTEPNLVRNGGQSTVWEVVREKIEYYCHPFLAILTRGIQFRLLQSWSQCYHLLLTNLNAAISLYQQNRHIFTTFERIEQQSKQHERLAKQHSADEQSREKFGDRNGNARTPGEEERGRATVRPPWEEKRRLFDTHKMKILPFPSVPTEVEVTLDPEPSRK